MYFFSLFVSIHNLQTVFSQKQYIYIVLCILGGRLYFSNFRFCFTSADYTVCLQTELVPGYCIFEDTVKFFGIVCLQTV